MKCECCLVLLLRWCGVVRERQQKGELAVLAPRFRRSWHQWTVAGDVRLLFPPLPSLLPLICPDPRT